MPTTVNKAAVFEELAKSLRAPESTYDDSSGEKPAADLDQPLLKLIADVATGLWRLRSKLIAAGSTDSEEHRRTQMHFESILDTLTEAGVEIRDHTGELVPRGGIYTLQVLAYEPRTGLTTERVIETIKPTIYFKERVIQVGQVIMGTPVASEEQINVRAVAASNETNLAAPDLIPERN